EARERAAQSTSLRPLALSYGSRLIFERLAVWRELATTATPIARIHISQRGRFGRSELTAREAGLPNLGYVLDYTALARALDAAVFTSRLEVIRGATVTSVAHGATSARVEFSTVDGVRDCIGSLVVVADGSALAADLEVRTIDYRQSAVTARVDTELPHRHTAYERFTPDGPIALLPFQQSYGLVWTTRSDEADELVNVTAPSFLNLLQDRFGERVGRFVAVGARSAQRLTLRVAQRTTWGRAFIIGNAAQALHPVAGQGFNLGLRDAWELATEIQTRGPRDEHLFNAYRARRRIDRAGGIAFTDALIRIFSNDFLPLGVARGAGLTLLDCLPAAKNFVVRRMIFGTRG
ncbi:MAG: 2-octaprenyl-6-methoxyphenol hydroxylase, partial [Betaproteobacteria bacterium]|nr:2-octaprenyl-6-methoxyphenol hydroxylase [Betaproteobacteria bacterium]